MTWELEHLSKHDRWREAWRRKDSNVAVVFLPKPSGGCQQRFGQLHSKGEQCIALPPHQNVHKSLVVHLSKQTLLACVSSASLSYHQFKSYCLRSRYPSKAPKLSILTGTFHTPLSIFFLHKQQQRTNAHHKADFPADELCAICIRISWFAREFATPHSNSLSHSSCTFGLISYNQDPNKHELWNEAWFLEH